MRADPRKLRRTLRTCARTLAGTYGLRAPAQWRAAVAAALAHEPSLPPAALAHGLVFVTDLGALGLSLRSPAHCLIDAAAIALRHGQERHPARPVARRRAFAILAEMSRAPRSGDAGTT